MINRYKYLIVTFLVVSLEVMNLYFWNQPKVSLFVVMMLLIIILIINKKSHSYIKQLKLYDEVAMKILETKELINIPSIVVEDEAIIGLQYNKLMRFLQGREHTTRLNMQIISSVTSIIEAPVLIIDMNGKIDYANDSFKQWIGKHDIEKMSFRKIENKALKKIIQDALICEITRKNKFEINAKSELEMNHKYYLSTSNPIYDENQVFKGVVILFHDVTDLKKYQNLQKDFFGNASHELKTPISAIKGCTEILLNGPHDEETTTEFLSIIQNENERLERLVKDLILINRYDFAQVKLKKQKLNLNELIGECILQVLTIANLKKQKIVLNAPQEVSFKGDYSKLQQSFLNLLTNAIHYSGDETTITICLMKEKRNIEIKVIDQGIGIPEKDLPHVFERFYRVDKARSRHTGGTGLGLSIVQSIIEAHGGTINVESLQDEGTTFTINL